MASLHNLKILKTNVKIAKNFFCRKMWLTKEGWAKFAKLICFAGPVRVEIFFDSD